MHLCAIALRQRLQPQFNFNFNFKLGPKVNELLRNIVCNNFITVLLIKLTKQIFFIDSGFNILIAF